MFYTAHGAAASAKARARARTHAHTRIYKIALNAQATRAKKKQLIAEPAHCAYTLVVCAEVQLTTTTYRRTYVYVCVRVRVCVGIYTPLSVC